MTRIGQPKVRYPFRTSRIVKRNMASPFVLVAIFHQGPYAMLSIREEGQKLP